MTIMYYYYCTVYFIHCCFVYNRCKVLSYF